MIIDCEEVDRKGTTFWIMVTAKRTYKDTPHLQRVYIVEAKPKGDRWVFHGLSEPLKAVFDICNSFAIDRDEARASIHRWADRTESNLKSGK